MTVPRKELIYILDDDDAVRDSLCALLDLSGYDTEAFPTASAFLDGFATGAAICAFLDVRLPDGSGLDVSRALRKRAPDLPVVIMTGHADVPMAVQAMREGACDFIEKPFDEPRLLDSIERARSHATPAPDPDPDLAGRFKQLTPRENDVLRELIAGNPNKIIAHNLGLSPRTVEVHRGRVMKKTASASLSQLVRMAIEAGITSTGSDSLK